jgi:hypothetical protein
LLSTKGAKGPKPVDSEELLADLPLALVAAKPLALKAAMPPSAKGTGGGALSSGLGAGVGESAAFQRIDELQMRISRLALQGPGTENNLPLVPGLPMALALFDALGRVGGSSVCVQGSLDGYKLGAAGAPNTTEFFNRLDHLGMRPVTAQDRARIQRYIGADRVDLFVRFRDCAEAQGVQQSFKLGEMEVQPTRSRTSTPAMAIVLAYWGRLQGEIGQLLRCGEDVFSPDHPSYERFFVLASLAVFLEHTVRYFVTETDFNWGIVWRYSCV